MIRKFSLRIIVTLAGLLVLNPVPAQALSLTANFNLFGEVYRVNTLGYGEMNLRVALDGTELAQGAIKYAVGFGPPTTSGVLSSLILPSTGFAAVDVDFAVPLDINTDHPASLEVALYAAGIRLAYDFANDITFTGSKIINTGEQGLVLTSLTLANGHPLAEMGLQYAFIFGNTSLYVELSNGSRIYKDAKSPPDIASLLYPEGTIAVGLASADPMVKLSVCPEPNTPIVDYCKANIGGSNNLLVSMVPLPGAIWLLSSGLLGITGAAHWRKKR